MSRRPRGIDSYATAAGTRWRYRIDGPRGADGQRRRIVLGGFESMAEAVEALDDERKAKRQGRVPATRSTTLAQYLPLWLEGLAVKPTTAANYRTCIDTYTLPRIGGLRLRDLQPEHLDALYRDLEQSGSRTGGPLAPKTVRHVHVMLRKALQDAAERGHVLRNAADLAHPPTQKQTRSKNARDKAWTRDQLRAFLQAVQEAREAPMWTLFAMTGMRRGEVLALRWDAVDLDAGQLTVKRTVTTANGQVVWQDTAKTDAGERTIALDTWTIAVLRQHRTDQLRERLLFGQGGPNLDGLLFTRPDLEPLSPNAVTQQFRKITDRAQLPRIGLHGLRHTYATAALRAGVSCEVLSKRLGHADVAVTLSIYAHVMGTDDADAAATAAASILGL